MKEKGRTEDAAVDHRHKPVPLSTKYTPLPVKPLLRSAKSTISTARSASSTSSAITYNILFAMVFPLFPAFMVSMRKKHKKIPAYPRFLGLTGRMHFVRLIGVPLIGVCHSPGGYPINQAAEFMIINWRNRHENLYGKGRNR
jgi:hypothetical protein